MGRVTSPKTFNFTTWWRDDINVEDRLILNGEPYNIRSVSNQWENNKFIFIAAENGVEQ
jgi:SPP1 family predicted phage head-tail adaptor